MALQESVTNQPSRIYMIVCEPTIGHASVYGMSEHAVETPTRMPIGTNGEGYVTLIIQTNWDFDWNAWYAKKGKVSP